MKIPIAPQILFSCQSHPLDKPSFEIYVAGCNKRCEGCHNPELWTFDERKHIKVTPHQLLFKIQDLSNFYYFIKDIIILGGEPLLYKEALTTFFKLVKTHLPNISLGVYSGFEEEEINWEWEIFQYINWIKIGEYKESLKSTNSKLASLNQTFIFPNKI